MMVIKGILFDKDGTLINSESTWVPFYKNLLRREKALGDNEIERYMIAAGYQPETNDFRGGSMLAGASTRELVEFWWPGETAETHRVITTRMQDESIDVSLKYIEPVPALAKTLDTLHRHPFLLGVATNDGERSARAHMEHLGVAKHFTDIIGSDTVAAPKPAGHMIRRFAQVTGIAPETITMIGDNSHDMQEARAGGAGLAIAVLTGNSTRADIAPYADHVIDGLADLPALLKTISLQS
jgi:phosphoglycolate phosphatase